MTYVKIVGLDDVGKPRLPLLEIKREIPVIDIQIMPRCEFGNSVR